MRPQDYTKYSVAELREALSTVDGLKYPENKAAIEAELQKRIDAGDDVREKEQRDLIVHEKEQGHRRFARSARPWIGLYLMGAPLILLSLGADKMKAVGWVTYTIWGLLILYVGIAAVAGYGLWKNKDWSRRLAMGVFALQIISVQSGSLVFSLTSAIAAFFYIAPASFTLGVEAYLTMGGFRLAIGDLGIPLTVGFNLFAIFMIWLLVKARQPVDGEEAGINTRPEGWTDPDLDQS